MSATDPRSLKALLQPLTQHPYLLLSVTALLSAGNVVASRLAVGQVSPMVATAGRWVLVLIVLGTLCRRQVITGLPVVRPQWRGLLAMGATGFTGFNALFYIAAHHTSGVNIAILQGSMPVFIMLGALVLHRTPIRGGQGVGLLLALAGVALVASHGDLRTLLTLKLNVGDLMMLGACLLVASFSLSLRGRAGASSLAFFAGLALAAFLSSLPLLAAEMALGAAQWPTLAGLALIAYVGLAPSFIAQMCYLRAVELIGPGRASLFINLVPVLGALMSVWILREPFGLHHAAALGLVLAGILLAERSALAAPPAPVQPEA